MLRPTLQENGIKLVAVGLEQFGAREFVDGQFFDGGMYVCSTHYGNYVIQWNLSNPDTLGTEESVLISEVS